MTRHCKRVGVEDFCHLPTHHFFQCLVLSDTLDVAPSHDASDHQDYYILSRESQAKPSFTTDPSDTQIHWFIYTWPIDAPHLLTLHLLYSFLTVPNSPDFLVNLSPLVFGSVGGSPGNPPFLSPVGKYEVSPFLMVVYHDQFMIQKEFHHLLYGGNDFQGSVSHYRV